MKPYIKRKYNRENPNLDRSVILKNLLLRFKN